MHIWAAAADPMLQLPTTPYYPLVCGAERGGGGRPRAVLTLRRRLHCGVRQGDRCVVVTNVSNVSKGQGQGRQGRAAAEPVPEKPAVWGQVANAVVYGVPSTLKNCVVRLWWGESAVCSLESVVKNRMDIRKNGI